jgi:isopenicillin N synthase-like dioxygenase
VGARKTDKIKDSLTGKGFVERDTHHCYFWLHIDGKRKAIFTFYSHGARECGDPLLKMMAKQLKLSRKQFDDLVDCPLNGEGYLEILREGGHIKE